MAVLCECDLPIKAQWLLYVLPG